MQVQAVCNSTWEFPLCVYSSNSTDGLTWNPKYSWVGDPWLGDNNYIAPPNVTITTPTVIFEPVFTPPVIDTEPKKEKKFRRLLRPIKE